MMDVPPTSPATQRAYDLVIAAAIDRGAEAGKMFGMPTLKVGGKAFAGLFGDAVVFKLGGEAHAGALALAGAQLFDPSGMGRPMREWVVVPAAHAKRWQALGQAAQAYAGAPAPKRTAPAKKKTAAKKTAAKKAPVKAPRR